MPLGKGSLRLPNLSPMSPLALVLASPRAGAALSRADARARLTVVAL